MSPAQYRALEALAGAYPDGVPVAREAGTVPGRLHPRTAEALERRGFATIRTAIEYGSDDLATATEDGLAHLERRPTPLGSSR